MVDADLGNFAHGQAEMTSQWCHGAVVHAGVKVCARHTGVRAGGPRGEGTGLVFIKERVSLKKTFADLSLSFPLSEKG